MGFLFSIHWIYMRVKDSAWYPSSRALSKEVMCRLEATLSGDFSTEFHHYQWMDKRTKTANFMTLQTIDFGAKNIWKT